MPDIDGKAFLADRVFLRKLDILEAYKDEN